MYIQILFKEGFKRREEACDKWKNIFLGKNYNSLSFDSTKTFFFPFFVKASLKGDFPCPS